MLVLPGGGLGTKNLNESPVVDRWLHYAAEKGIWIAAICAAPSVLGNKGLLDQKRAVAYPGFEPKGSIYAEGEFVVRDGNYITAKGAGVCLEFALELVSCLKGKATAEKVKDEIQCRK